MRWNRMKKFFIRKNILSKTFDQLTIAISYNNFDGFPLRVTLEPG